MTMEFVPCFKESKLYFQTKEHRIQGKHHANDKKQIIQAREYQGSETPLGHWHEVSPYTGRRVKHNTLCCPSECERLFGYARGQSDTCW
jgi:hypothetical protein